MAGIHALKTGGLKPRAFSAEINAPQKRKLLYTHLIPPALQSQLASVTSSFKASTILFKILAVLILASNILIDEGKEEEK